MVILMSSKNFILISAVQDDLIMLEVDLFFPMKAAYVGDFATLSEALSGLSSICALACLHPVFLYLYEGFGPLLF